MSIQDAHEIPDAQRNIQKLIDFLQTQYAVRLVALEGAASDLDPQIFKSFPDQTVLKKVFEQYFDQGELAGGTAAAIFSAEGGSASGGNPTQTIFTGVEDWNLYEEGLKHFLDAMGIEESVTKRLEGLLDELKKEKEKYYSKELLDIDLALQTFRKNATDLITILEKLAAVRPPENGSELALLLEEIGRSRQNDSSVEMEVKRIAEQIRSSLRVPRSGTKQSLLRHSEGEARRISRTEILRSAQDDLFEFNQKFQESQTQRIAPEAFALFLKPLAMKYRIKVKVSKRLNYLVGNQKRMKDIQGTKLFDDFEKYARSIKESLFQNDEERKLDAWSRQLELMERLAKLELSREDWIEVKEIFNEIQYWNVTKNGVSGEGDIANLLQEMRPQVSFYHNAGKRDHAFIQQVDSLFQKHKAKSAAFIAGGFHAEGITYNLKSQGISYVLIMPKIGRMPDETHYRDHMKGEVSWSDYFEVQDGKVNLFNAFVRGTRELLLKFSKEERGRVLKEWRDQIIRDLAEKGKLTESSQYTRFIDEVSEENKKDGLLVKWKTNINRFIEGLHRLQSKGQITEENIGKLFQLASIPTGATAAPIARSELRVNLIPNLRVTKQLLSQSAAIQAVHAHSRSEMRVAEKTQRSYSQLTDAEIIREAEKTGIKKSFVVHEANANFGRPIRHLLISTIFALIFSLQFLLAIDPTQSSWMLAGFVYLLYAALNFNIIEGTLSDLAAFRPMPLLPEMDFKQGIPTEQKTVVFYPILFRNERELGFIEKNLLPSIENNNDLNVVWVVMSGSDEDMSQKEVERFEALTKRFPGKLYYFHRSKHLNNWEKKRGGYMHFMKWVVEGKNPARTITKDENFPAMPAGEVFDLILGDVSSMGHIENLLASDSDSIWPPGSVKKMVAKIAHPTNEGFTIFQGMLTLHNIKDSILTAMQFFLYKLFKSQAGAQWKNYGRVNFLGHGGGWNIRKFLSGIAGKMADGYLSHDIPESYFLKTAFVAEVETTEEAQDTVENLVKQWARWWKGNRIFSLRLLGLYRPDEKGNYVRNKGNLIGKALLLDADRNYLMAPTLVAFISILTVATTLGLSVFNTSIWATLGPFIFGMILLKFYTPLLSKIRNGSLASKVIFTLFFSTILGFTLLVELNKIVIKDTASVTKQYLIGQKQENKWTVQGSLERRKSFTHIFKQTGPLTVGAGLLTAAYWMFASHPSAIIMIMLISVVIAPFIVWYAAQPPPKWLISEGDSNAQPQFSINSDTLENPISRAEVRADLSRRDFLKTGISAITKLVDVKKGAILITDISLARSEIRKVAVDLNQVANSVINALDPRNQVEAFPQTFTRSELRRIYEISTSDLDSFTNAILKTWSSRIKERAQTLDEDIDVAQAALEESEKLLDYLRFSHDDTASIPKRIITVGLRLSVQNNTSNTSFLTQLFKVLQGETQHTELLVESGAVRNLPVKETSNLSVRPVNDWKRHFPLRSDQEDVPVSLDPRFLAEAMNSMFTGLVLNRSKARLGPTVDDFQDLVAAVSLVELAKISADPQHRSKLRRLATNPKAKAEYLKTQLLRRLADLGYPPEMFVPGQNGYLTIEGTIAVAFLEMKAKETLARAA